MAIINGVGTSWNLPNYHGELFTADPTQTPLLTMIGGLSGGMSVNAPEFATGQLYSLPAPTQPEISENESIIAPAPRHIAREQFTNSVQIHHSSVDITYVKQGSFGKMSGLNTAGQQANPINEFDWQLNQHIIQIARDVEYSFINGEYQRATSATVAGKTRGLLELTQTTDGYSLDAAGAPLTKAMLSALFLGMTNNGAQWMQPVLFVNARLRQVITEIYSLVAGFALPPSRNVGGLSINEITMEFANLGIVFNRFMPDDAVLVADVAYLAPVFQEVPGKGVFFVEELAKIGASERAQLFGMIGLDHGVAHFHGAITNIG